MFSRKVMLFILVILILPVYISSAQYYLRVEYPIAPGFYFAEVNGVKIYDPSQTVYVNPGDSIEGFFDVKVVNIRGGAWITPVIGTASWTRGDFQCITSDAPSGESIQSYHFYLKAPETPGTYYIGIFAGWMYSCAEVASNDHPPQFNDGDDVWDMSQSDWESIISTGSATKYNQPGRAIRIVVQGATPPPEQVSVDVWTDKGGKGVGNYNGGTYSIGEDIILYCSVNTDVDFLKVWVEKPNGTVVLFEGSAKAGTYEFHGKVGEPAGERMLKAYAYKSGQTAKDETKFYAVSANKPPILTLFEPQVSGLTVTVNGVANPGYEGVSITRIHWDWGDGSKEDHWFPTTHTYSSAGTYTITVTAYQSDGLSTTKTLSVKVEAENKPPTAYIDSISPNPAYEGQTISFSGHGYDPDGKVAECDWRADGTVLSSSCSFSTSLPPGKYTIYFRVKDDKGAWSKWVTETLEVKAKQKEEIPKEGAEKLSELARGKSAFFRSLAEFIDKKTDPRKYLDQFASDLRNLGEFLGKPPENVEEASKKALKDFLLKIIDPNGVIDTADALGKISTVTAYAFMESADVNFWYVIWTNEPLKSDLKTVAEEMNKAADLYDEEANCWEGITKGKCDIDHLKNILNREKDQLIKLKATVNEKIENVLSVFRNPSPEVVLNDYKKVVEGDVLKYELPSPPYPCETVEISIEQVPKPAKNFWEFWITDPSYEIEIYPYYYYYPSSFQCQKDEKPLTSRPGACLVNRSLTYNTKSIFGSSMSVTWSVKDLYPLGTFEYDVLGLVIRVKDFGGDNTFTFWTDEGIKEAQIAVKMVYKSSGKYIQLYSFGAQQLENLRSNLITILDKYLDTINNTLTKL